MTTVILLTSRGCHLCQHGREVLDTLGAERILTWREVDADSDEGLRLAATAPPLRPVLCDADGHVIGYGRLSARRLRRQLTAAKTTRSRRRRAGCLVQRLGLTVASIHQMAPANSSGSVSRLTVRPGPCGCSRSSDRTPGPWLGSSIR